MLEIDRAVVQATAPVRDNVPDGSGVTPGRLRCSAPLRKLLQRLRRTQHLLWAPADQWEEICSKLKILPLVPDDMFFFIQSKSNYPICISAAGITPH